MKSFKNMMFELRDNRPLMRLSEFNRKAAAIVLVALLTGSSPVMIKAEWVDKIIEAGIIAGYDDNVNRSFFSSVKKDDMMVMPSASIGRIYQLADFTRLIGTANVRGEIRQDFDRLNSVFAGATLAVAHKFGVGPLKPWLRVHGSGGYLEVDDDPGLRDSWLLDTGFKVGKRLNDRVDVEVGYTFDSRNGQNASSVRPDEVPSGAVFDMDGHTGSVTSNVLLTNNFLLSLGYAFRHGDIASVCNGPIVATIVDKIDAVARDLAFEEPLCAYRIRGNTHDFSVATVYALSGHTSLNLMYHRVEGDASDLNYSNNRVNVSLHHNF